MEGAIFFRDDQGEAMANFVIALRNNGQRFKCETEVHGFWIIIL